MPKRMRSVRLEDRTWFQLERLAGWMKVSNNTSALERLVEGAFSKMAIKNIHLSDYVISTLQLGQGEIQARFRNEFSEEEKRALALAAKLGDSRVSDLDGNTNWVFEVLPELSNYTE